MTQHVPLSLVLHPNHIAWLDSQRQRGNLSRSAALRVALDRLIQDDQQPRPTAGQAHGG